MSPDDVKRLVLAGSLLIKENYTISKKNVTRCQVTHCIMEAIRKALWKALHIHTYKLYWKLLLQH